MVEKRYEPVLYNVKRKKPSKLVLIVSTTLLASALTIGITESRYALEKTVTKYSPGIEMMRADIGSWIDNIPVYKRKWFGD